MSNATPNRAGQVGAAGDVDALFLKVWSGETLAAFERTNVTMGRHMVRTIASGKSAQFPVFGKATASYHTPGNELLGGTIKNGERLISIDDILVSDLFLADIDEAKAHYDYRSVYTGEQGIALANQMDRHVLQVAVLAARSTATDVDLPTGTVITEAVAGDFDDATKLKAALFQAAQKLDEKDVPREGRVVFLKPSAYYTLIADGSILNRDFGNMGSQQTATLPMIAGFEIVMTNNIPTDNVTASSVAAGSGDNYVGDFRKTEFVAMHPSAVGTVKLLDLSTRIDYDPRRLGWLSVAKYAVGHGLLRPEAAVEGARA